MRIAGAIAGVMILAATASGGSALASARRTFRPEGPCMSMRPAVTGPPARSSSRARSATTARRSRSTRTARPTITATSSGSRSTRFEVDSAALNAKTNHAQPVVNKTTCSIHLSGTGPVTFFNGTGLYQGIKGKALITVSYGGVGPRYKSGSHKGQCNFDNNTPPVAQYASITGPAPSRSPDRSSTSRSPGRCAGGGSGQ